MATWLTWQEIVDALAIGPVGYGCSQLGQYRDYNSVAAFVADVPNQAQVDADESACNAAVASTTTLTTDQVTAIATDISSTQVAQVTPAVTAAAATASAAQIIANEALAAAQRSTTTPVPIQVIQAADYAAATTDQRFLHNSPNPHTLTLIDPKIGYERVFLAINKGPGTFTVRATNSSFSMVLSAGDAIQVVSSFVPGDGSVASPADLEVDGSSSTLTGAYEYWLYNHVTAALASQMANLQEEIMSFQPGFVKNAPVVKTAAYSAAAADSLIECQTGSASFAVTLPNSGPANNQIEVEWNSGTAAPTVAFATGASLSTANAGEVVFPMVGASLTFQYDGTSTYTLV